MSGRLAGKTAVVVGAGQQPGETIGNGKAIALTFAREGAEVLCVDRDLARAEATVTEITAGGGTGFALGADIVGDSEAIVAVKPVPRAVPSPTRMSFCPAINSMASPSMR